MAHRRHNYTNVSEQRDRSTRSLADPLSALLAPPRLGPLLSRYIYPTNQLDLSAAGDRRRFGQKVARQIDGNPSEFYEDTGVRIAPHPSSFQRGLIMFRDAERALVCVRRKMRREVIFAFNKEKKGSGGGRHRNEYTNVRC